MSKAENWAISNKAGRLSASLLLFDANIPVIVRTIRENAEKPDDGFAVGFLYAVAIAATEGIKFTADSDFNYIVKP